MRVIYTSAILLVVLLGAVYLAAPPVVHAGDGSGVTAILDCVSYDEASQQVTANWGYVDINSSSSIVPFGSSNFFDPAPGFRLQPIEFFPGIHHNVFTTTWSLSDTRELAWVLGGTRVAARNDPTRYCSSPKVTYQGRLKDGDSPANGTYDLEFKLFSTGTGGGPNAATQLQDVQVINGVFTVQLDFTRDQLRFGPFLEIGVRPGAQTGAYTTLSPRQAITPTPYALLSSYAVKSGDAETLGGVTPADYLTRGNLATVGASSFIVNGTSRQTGSFNLSGDGTIGGNLTVTGTLNATLPAGSSSYIQNTTSQQTGNFNLSGDGTVGGTLSSSFFSISSANNLVGTAQSSSVLGTWLRLGNSSTGGHTWELISAGKDNGEGAGNLVFRDTGGGQVVINNTLRVPNCAGCTNAPSDRNLKANFAPISGTTILRRLAGLPIQTWNYRSDGTGVRHLGPMAQDFYAAFSVGTDDRHINLLDSAGVALAASQELYRLQLASQQQIDRLNASNAVLKASNADLAKRLTALEEKFEKLAGKQH